MKKLLISLMILFSILIYNNNVEAVSNILTYKLPYLTSTDSYDIYLYNDISYLIKNNKEFNFSDILPTFDTSKLNNKNYFILIYSSSSQGKTITRLNIDIYIYDLNNNLYISRQGYTSSYDMANISNRLNNNSNESKFNYYTYSYESSSSSIKGSDFLDGSLFNKLNTLKFSLKDSGTLNSIQKIGQNANYLTFFNKNNQIYNLNDDSRVVWTGEKAPIPPFDPTQFIFNKNYETGKVVFNIDIGSNSENYDIYYNFNKTTWNKIENFTNFEFSEKVIGQQYLYIDIRPKGSNSGVYTKSYEFYFDYTDNTGGKYPAQNFVINKFFEPGKMILQNTILNANYNYKIKFFITSKDSNILEKNYFEGVYVEPNSKIIINALNDTAVNFKYEIYNNNNELQFIRTGSGYIRMNSGGGYYPGSGQDLESGLNPNDPVGSLQYFFNTCKNIFDTILDMIKALPIWITAPLSLFFLLFSIIGIKKLIFG